MSRPPLYPTQAAKPACLRLPGIGITLKPDKVTLGDFPVPALRAEPLAVSEPPMRPRPENQPRPTARPVAPPAKPPRRWRPPRMPEPIYAVLRRMAVEIVCCGFIGIAVLAVGYRLARVALH